MRTQTVLTLQSLHQQVCAHRSSAGRGGQEPRLTGGFPGEMHGWGEGRPKQQQAPSCGASSITVTGDDQKRVQPSAGCDPRSGRGPRHSGALPAQLSRCPALHPFPGVHGTREAKPRRYKVRQTLLIHCTITTISYSCRIRKGYNYNVTCTNLR